MEFSFHSVAKAQGAALVGFLDTHNSIFFLLEIRNRCEMSLSTKLKCSNNKAKKKNDEMADCCLSQYFAKNFREFDVQKKRREKKMRKLEWQKAKRTMKQMKG